MSTKESPISSVNHIEPTARTYYWLGNLRTEFRFQHHNKGADKTPEPYMLSHRETVYEHICSLVKKTRELYKKYPQLNTCFSEDDVIEILWLHEAEEIIYGDESWGEQFITNGLESIGGSNTAQVIRVNREQLLPVFRALFNDEETAIKWTDNIVEFDNWKYSSKATILFAKLLDVLHGNQTVIDHGNNLAEHAKSMAKFLGHRFALLMERLSATSEMKRYPSIFSLIENELVLHQIGEYREKGVNISYNRLAAGNTVR